MRVVVVGAGGHARSVIEALRTAGELEPVGCTDPDPGLAGSKVDGVPVLGGDDRLPELLRGGVEGACLGVGGVGDNSPRRLLYERLTGLGFELPVVIHARAIVTAGARLGPASQALAGAIVGPGARIGANVIVNSGAIVEHDCEIADHVHVATGCAIGGGVRVGEGAHLGIGAAILQGLTVGAEAVVGGGAVVIRNVPAGEIVAGSPASAIPRGG